MVCAIDTCTVMKMFVDVNEIYLYRDLVDFRKAINGLVVLVEQQMALSPFADALFVFCNKGRDKVNTPPAKAGGVFTRYCLHCKAAIEK